MRNCFTPLFLALLCVCTPLLAWANAAALPATPAQFAAANVPDWADRAAVQTALEDAGANWTELAQALLALTPAGGEDSDAGQAYHSLVWLITSAPHLDRLELKSAMLTSNVQLATAAAQEHGYDPASEFFQRYVLNYRLDDEPVTSWRAKLARRYGQADSPSAIAATVAEAFTVRERGYFGPLADPLSVDNARAGTGQELAVLTAAAVRSHGFGTRFVREGLSGKSWVEVYTGDPHTYDAAAWTPLYPNAPEHNGDATYATELCGGRLALVTAGDAFGQEQVTARYGQVCGVTVDFTRGGAPVPDYEHWSITATHKGQIVPLDDLGYPLGELDYPLDAGPDGRTVYYVGAPGEYQLQAGVRYPNGVVHLLTCDFTAQPDGLVELKLALDAPNDLPAAALAERQVTLPAPAPGTPRAAADAPRAWLYVVYDGSEPSVRALGLLEPFKTDPRLGYEDSLYTTANATAVAFIHDVLLVKDEDLKPVVVLVIDGETKLYRLGYDLSIAQWIERALVDAGL
jgi:hypothetical protein